jgi:outer membrane immunogenic protein
MRKIKLIIATLGMLSLVSSSSVSADGFAPGEGLYMGAFVGGGMGIVQPKVATTGSERASGAASHNNDGHAAGTFEATDGGLGLAGIEGGGTIGYGYKMGDLYAGLEGEMAAGDVKFKLTSESPITLAGSNTDGSLKTLSTVEATKDWTGGMFGRLGYYVNADTLVAFRGGVLVSRFDVKTTGSEDFSETFYGGGPSFGASLESRITAIDPSLSVRVGAVYTDFLTASVFGLGTNVAHANGHNSEVTGSALSTRIGLQYSFFDVNSLF